MCGDVSKTARRVLERPSDSLNTGPATPKSTMLVRPVKNPMVAIDRPNLGLPFNPCSAFNCLNDMLDAPINSLQEWSVLSTLSFVEE
jgi:hypothetical protein